MRSSCLPRQDGAIRNEFQNATCGFDLQALPHLDDCLWRNSAPLPSLAGDASAAVAGEAALVERCLRGLSQRHYSARHLLLAFPPQIARPNRAVEISAGPACSECIHPCRTIFPPPFQKRLMSRLWLIVQSSDRFTTLPYRARAPLYHTTLRLLHLYAVCGVGLILCAGCSHSGHVS